MPSSQHKKSRDYFRSSENTRNAFRGSNVYKNGGEVEEFRALFLEIMLQVCDGSLNFVFSELIISLGFNRCSIS